MLTTECSNHRSLRRRVKAIGNFVRLALAAKASLPYEKAKLLPMAAPMAEAPLIPRPGYPGDISNHPLREGLLAPEAAGNR